MGRCSGKHVFHCIRVLAFMVCFLTCGSFLTGGQDPTDTEIGYAIVPLRDSRASELKEESIPGLGRTIANELRASFIEHLPKDSSIRIVKEELVDMALDELGLEQLGLVKHSDVMKVGEIVGADYVWYGDYSYVAGDITIHLALWSLRTGAAVSGTSVKIENYFFADRQDYIQAIACSLFKEMYEITLGSAPQIECSALSSEGITLPDVIVIQIPFPMGYLLSLARISLTGVKMGFANNIIEEARARSHIKMQDIRWATEVDLRLGYAFMGGMEIIGGVKYITATTDAGASANISLSLSSTALLAGLAYHLKVSGIEVVLEARGGWGGARLSKRDQFGLLDCPALVAGQGIAFEASAMINIPISSTWSIHTIVGYRGADLSTPLLTMPKLDLSGVILGLSLGATIGGTR